MIKIKSLQFKLIVIVGSILILAGLMLTAVSIYNANNKFGQIEDAVIFGMAEYYAGEEIPGQTVSYAVQLDSPLSDGEIVDVKPITQQFAHSSIIYLFGIIFMGIVAAFVAVNRALQPMKTLNNTIQHIDEHHLSMRVHDDGRGDEVSQLAGGFNHMLERLEKVFQLQKNFASSAAHELKTPIAVMKASLQVLELDETPSVEDYKENTAIIKQEVEKLRLIVEDLFSLNSSVAVEFKEAISLKKLLKNIAVELKAFGEAKDIALAVNLQESISKDSTLEDIILYGNSNLVYRAIFNLMENAMKYNHAGGQVNVYTVINEGLEIHIKDTGTGISAQAMNYIYEPFYREDNVKKSDEKGIGLGLSIVKNIIDKHEWQLEVESEIGVGTEFVVKVGKKDFEVRTV